MALRAAAFENTDQTRDFASGNLLGRRMTLKQMTPGQDKYLVSLFKLATEKAKALVAEQRKQSHVLRLVHHSRHAHHRHEDAI